GGGSLRPPQLARCKAHRIQVLRFLPETRDEAVVEDIHAAVAHDGALFTARIAWQARVAHGVEVARAHALALVELRRHRHLACRGAARGDPRRDLLSAQHVATLGIAPLGDPGFQLGAGHHAALDQQFRQARQPALVVTHPQIVSGWNELPLIAPGATWPITIDRHIHGEYAPLPCGVEHRLILLGPHRPHVLHASHVVDAVHACAPAWGAMTRATPTIA